ncbi:uncharacterized protein LOC142874376 [Microcebus murinus]|uniref:uncharacterized protein LOC142874376 n=1 Tax=Microcebus murinus TaxID=30608 RepID=UPI003F6B4702
MSPRPAAAAEQSQDVCPGLAALVAGGLSSPPHCCSLLPDWGRASASWSPWVSGPQAGHSVGAQDMLVKGSAAWAESPGWASASTSSSTTLCWPGGSPTSGDPSVRAFRHLPVPRQQPRQGTRSPSGGSSPTACTPSRSPHGQPRREGGRRGRHLEVNAADSSCLRPRSPEGRLGGGLAGLQGGWRPLESEALQCQTSHKPLRGECVLVAGHAAAQTDSAAGPGATQCFAERLRGASPWSQVPPGMLARRPPFRPGRLTVSPPDPPASTGTPLLCLSPAPPACLARVVLTPSGTHSSLGAPEMVTTATAMMFSAPFIEH